MIKDSGDPIVEKMIAKIRLRSALGQEKYGDTMQGEIDSNVKNFLDYLADIEEELFDAIIYMQAFKAAMIKEGHIHKLFKE